MAILQTLGIVSCMGGPMRLCGYAAEMLRNEFARQKQKRLQLQWHMVYPENQGSKEEKLANLNKAINQSQTSLHVVLTIDLIKYAANKSQVWTN